MSDIMHSISRLVDSLLAIEKERIRCDIRLSHLKLQGSNCEDTATVRDMLLAAEDWIQKRINSLIVLHPAYPWFSLIRGVGTENIAKCIAPIRIKPSQGYRKNKATKKMELVDLPYADHISDVWQFSGVGLRDGKALRPTPGETLPYNAELRTMWWRLGSSILKSGLRQKCSKCGALVGMKSTKDDAPPDKAHRCPGAEFRAVAISKFAGEYLKAKKMYQERHLAAGGKIVPATQLPKDAEGKRREIDGFMSEGHIHAMALRKMIKLFIACLVLVWREEEGLPETKPYPIDKLGHRSMIDPWSMIDKEPVD